MKTAIFTIKLWENNEFIFDSNQNSFEIIKDIYEKKIKPKYPNFDFDVWVEDDEDYDEENECYSQTFFHIRYGKIE